ncbi:MAG: cupredoxin domain-containing protein [Acidimicrobiales bacterium]
MRFKRFLVVGLATAALVVGLAACGGGGSAKSLSSSAADLVAKDNPTPHFEPNTLKATAGSDVAFSFHNSGKVVHNFTLSFADVDQDVQPGQTVQVKFKVPDRVKGLNYFTFYDKTYQGQGMQGRLNVG